MQKENPGFELLQNGIEMLKIGKDGFPKKEEGLVARRGRKYTNKMEK